MKIMQRPRYKREFKATNTSAHDLPLAPIRPSGGGLIEGTQNDQEVGDVGAVHGLQIRISHTSIILAC
jgi:hypothetical protein